MKTKSYEIDMCNGDLFPKILAFSIPLMLSSILQLLFNAADMVVVGRFTGSTALAAVGANASLINLLTNLFIGFSVGANVMVAQSYGAKKQREMSETVHSAIVLSLICGCVLLALGIVAAPEILILMGTPEDVLGQAVLYIRIYFSGMPVILLYNFGSSILRAVGDTRRPLYYLLAAGVINIILNLLFWHWCGRCGSGHRDFSVRVCRFDCALHDAYGGRLPAGNQETWHEAGSGDTDYTHRASGRSAGNSIFSIQCLDTIFCQCIWFSGDGWKYCGFQY